mmetsp:Transcript_86525/g.279249  ORF Transcript_86525/g.279249 Transcript_86525/m.279249 type:complete len:1550 (+) Transcript_86525:96-4745(+)
MARRVRCEGFETLQEMGEASPVNWSDLYDKTVTWIDKAMPSSYADESKLHSVQFKSIFTTIAGNFAAAACVWLVSSAGYIALLGSGQTAWIFPVVASNLAAFFVFLASRWWEGGSGGNLSREIRLEWSGGTALLNMLAVAWSMRSAEPERRLGGPEAAAVAQFNLGMVRPPAKEQPDQPSTHKTKVLCLSKMGEVEPHCFRVAEMGVRAEGSKAYVDLLENFRLLAARGKDPAASIAELVKDEMISNGDKFILVLKEETFTGYLWRCFQHRGVQAALSIWILFLLLLPSTLYLENIKLLQKQYCGSRGDQSVLPDFLAGDALRCQGKHTAPCPELCLGGVAFALFMKAVNETLKVPELELMLPAILAVVSLLVVSIYREERVMQSVQSFFIHQTYSRQAVVRELRAMTYSLEEYVNFGSACLRLQELTCQLWHNHPPWSCSGLENHRLNGVNGISGNHTLTSVMKQVARFADVGDEIEDLDFSLDRCSNVGDGEHVPATYAEMATQVAKKWDLLGSVYELDRRRHRFKVVVFVPIRTAQAFDIFVNDFLLRPEKDGGYKERLEWLCNPLNGPEESMQDNIGARSTNPFVLGSLILPAGFALSTICASVDGKDTNILVGNSLRAPKAARDPKSRPQNFQQLLTLLTPQKLPNGSMVFPDFQAYGTPKVLLHAVGACSAPVALAPGDSYGQAGGAEQAAQAARSASTPPDAFGGDCELGFLFECSTAQGSASGASASSARGLWEDVQQFLLDLQDGTIQECIPEAARAQALAEFKSAPHGSASSSKLTVRIQTTRKEVLRTIKSLIWNVIAPQAISMAVVFLFAWLIPIRRVFAGGSLLPAPFAHLLALNTLGTAIPLFIFFSMFETEVLRLDLVRGALEKLASRTTVAASDTSPEDIYEDPFKLCDCSETPYDPTQVSSMDQWRGRFGQLLKNVRHWSCTETHLRTSLCVSRLMSEFLLLVVVLLMLSLLVFSLAEVASGTGGMLQLDSTKLHDLLARDVHTSLEANRKTGRELALELEAKAHQALHNASLHVHDGIHNAINQTEAFIANATTEAMHRLSNLTTGEVDAAVGVITERHLPHAAAAARALREALRPLQAEQQKVLRLGLMGIANQVGDALRSQEFQDYTTVIKGVDLGKVTASQVLAMSMMLILLIFSSHLILAVSRINSLFDNNSATLLAQEDEHVKNQSRREEEAPAHDNPSKPPDASAGAAASSARAARERYEAVLRSSIESSKRKASRYAIRLFGFVITPALILGNLTLVAMPYFESAKRAAPSFVMTGCSLIEDSMVVSSLQHFIDEATYGANNATRQASDDIDAFIEGQDKRFDNATRLVDDALNSTHHEVAGRTGSLRSLRGETWPGRQAGGRWSPQEEGASGSANDSAKASANGIEATSAELPADYYSLVPDFNLKQSLHESFCKPLLEGVNLQMETLSEKVREVALLAEDLRNSDNASGARRLSADGVAQGAVPDLPSVVARWWAAYPDIDSEVKLAIASGELDILGLKAHHWLVHSPTVLQSAYTHGGLESALDMGILLLKQLPGSSGWNE